MNKRNVCILFGGISPEHEEILRNTGVELIIAPILGDMDDDQQYD